MHPRTPPRLSRVFSTAPLYFVTICTEKRKPLLANREAHESFRRYALAATEFRIAVGRYVLMPDHLHFFIRNAGEKTLGSWTGGLKRWIAKENDWGPRSWQRGFFDHVIRSSESYSQKWDYVRMNPVRAALVPTPEAWPHSGEIQPLAPTTL
jgi:putative transposase